MCCEFLDVCIENIKMSSLLKDSDYFGAAVLLDWWALTNGWFRYVLHTVWLTGQILRLGLKQYGTLKLGLFKYYVIKWHINLLHWWTLKKYLYRLYFSLNGESIKKRITKFWTYDENGSTLPTKGPNMDKNSLKKCFSISLDILKLKFALKCIFS